MESSVTFSQSTESTTINIPSIYQKLEERIPNPCTVKANGYAIGPKLSAEGTTLQLHVFILTTDNLIVF